MRFSAFLAAVAVGAGVSTAAAAEQAIELKAGPGLDKVSANCAACHSLDYILMNSPFLNATAWTAEVAKMRNAFGAPINDADAQIIVDYLSKNYGT